MVNQQGFLRSVELMRSRIDDSSAYPYAVPALRNLETLSLHPQVTFFVGENASGKSTLLEAIAVAAGFNPEGGTRNFRFATRRSESRLCDAVRLHRSLRRERTGFFLRAESMFNLATEIEVLDSIPAAAPPVIDSYGGRSLHEQSHGESFLAVMRSRFGPEGLYLLDEPESALSPQHQLSMLALIDRSVQSEGSQYVIATHSVILTAYPNAMIYELSDSGIQQCAYQDTPNYQLTRSFLSCPERYFRHLFSG